MSGGPQEAPFVTVRRVAGLLASRLLPETRRAAKKLVEEPSSLAAATLLPPPLPPLRRHSPPPSRALSSSPLLPPQLDLKKLLPRKRSSSGGSAAGGGKMGEQLPWTERELIQQCQREYETAAAHGGQEALDACFRWGALLLAGAVPAVVGKWLGAAAGSLSPMEVSFHPEESQASCLL